MKVRSGFTILLLFVFSHLFTSASYAQQISAEQYGTVLNLSGKQRMLTQKMSKEAMLIALNIDKQSNLSHLQSTSSLFDRTLTGLRKGDSELGLPPTYSRRILRQLDKVDALWSDFYPVIQQILTDGNVSSEQVAQIASQNGPLLVQMNKTVGQYEKAAAQSGLSKSPGLAVTLNLSGKQRMLSQKMSKEFLLVAYQYAFVENQLNLLETYTLFDRTLKGLQSGDESLGLPPTQAMHIKTQLDVVNAIWDEFKPFIEQALAPGTTELESELVAQVAKKNMPLLVEMNKAVGMYANQAAN